MKFLTVLITGFLFVFCSDMAEAQVKKPRVLQRNIDIAPAELAIPKRGTVIVMQRAKDTQRFVIQKMVRSGWTAKATPGDPYAKTSGYVGCWWNCRTDTHPIDVRAYRKLFPLKVGNKVTFRRDRKDKSATWAHVLQVTGAQRVQTPLGPQDVFVLKNTTYCQNPQTKKFDTICVESEDWWSPALGWSVYFNFKSSDGSDVERSLLSYDAP